jgi:hypothetical protein
MERLGRIEVVSLVAEARCPYDCPACADEARERQARRELIMLAEAELFDESVLPTSEVDRPLDRAARAD